jgi:hypothetical protein
MKGNSGHTSKANFGSDICEFESSRPSQPVRSASSPGTITPRLTSRCTIDLAHHPILLLEKPLTEFAYDTDPKMSAKSRVKMLTMLADNNNQRNPSPCLATLPMPGLSTR